MSPSEPSETSRTGEATKTCVKSEPSEDGGTG